MSENPLPNPGSDEALNQGCTCPVLDNDHGRGYYGGYGFVIVASCPLHGGYSTDPEDEEPDAPPVR